MRILTFFAIFLGTIAWVHATQKTSNIYQQPVQTDKKVAPPPDFVSVNDFLSRSDTFRTFTQEAINRKIDIGILARVSSGGPTPDTGGMTLLLPVDAAFNQVLANLKTLPDEQRANFIRAMIIKKRIPRSELYQRAYVYTYAQTGEELETKHIPRPIYTIETDNGIIHVLDRMPPTLPSLRHKVYPHGLEQVGH